MQLVHPLVACRAPSRGFRDSVAEHRCEPFLGSGTTLIAAETVRRVGFGIELDPLFVDVAVRRWQAFTGKEAILQSGGTFAEVSEERKREDRLPPAPGQDGGA